MVIRTDRNIGEQLAKLTPAQSKRLQERLDRALAEMMKTLYQPTKPPVDTCMHRPKASFPYSPGS